MTRFRPLLVVAVAVAACAVPGHSQIPETFQNLQRLAPDSSRDAVVAAMRAWSSALGVRCNHCHVGPDNLVGMDFASDEKATKRTARRMFDMVGALNRELLAELPVAAEGRDPRPVSCFTCHRGRALPPGDLVAELDAVAREDGLEPALDHYEAVRAESYGAGQYDFRPSTLARFARHRMESGDVAGAVRVLEASLGYDPGVADSHALLGMVRLQSGDGEGARRDLEKALELDPGNRSATRGLEVLEGQASGTSN